jgi:putative selenate reductase
MAELCPLPLGRLVTRMFRELERHRAIFDLEERRFVRGPGSRDLSVRFHGRTAATPLGPAAGPQSQLAQNLVLSFLGGSRIFELKTVQILDTLKIPRPCIDMQTVGYNVEWSQELTLEQSLEEYVKGSMLIEMLVASGALGLSPGFERTLFDMSVGYDLAGIRSDRVQAFVRGMMDARPIVDRLRGEIPDEYRRFRDLDYTTRLSDTLTLSTFHGCPPDEIERIIEFLLTDVALHCIVKLNPTLLGADEARRVFHDVLGYEEHIPDGAFAKDTRWDQAVGFVGRLGERAAGLGLGFGVKLTNTLIVENHRQFFPSSEKEMYLSGLPLHVLAMCLVGRFRETFGDRYPISFSAGIDKTNFPDAVGVGLCPVTVCSDLLRPKGYGRLQGYFAELDKRMAALGVSSIDDFVRAYGGADPGTELAEARVRSTQRYLEALLADPRYRRAANTKLPPKVGSRLVLFDCLTCDRCIPVCPNDANFTFTLPQTEIPIVRLRADNGSGWHAEQAGTLKIEKKHQIATYADFCNECGNCDVFCPEDGGPYVLKPRFFGTLESWERWKTHDGFHLRRTPAGDEVHGRFGGREYHLSVSPTEAAYAGDGFDLRLREDAPESPLGGRASAEVDLTYFHIMNWLRRAVLDGPEITWVSP